MAQRNFQQIGAVGGYSGAGPAPPIRRSAKRRFDAAATWARLDPEQQRWVGQAALVLIYTIDALDDTETNAVPVASEDRQAFAAAMSAGLQALRAAFWSVDAVGADEALLPPARPDLGAIGIRQCECCGCTDDHACPNGCEWVGPRLCSRCANSGDRQ